jgi:hypothetical protein
MAAGDQAVTLVGDSLVKQPVLAIITRLTHERLLITTTDGHQVTVAPDERLRRAAPNARGIIGINLVRAADLHQEDAIASFPLYIEYGWYGRGVAGQQGFATIIAIETIVGSAPLVRPTVEREAGILVGGLFVWPPAGAGEIR